MAETNEVTIHDVTATSDLGQLLFSLKRERPPWLEMIPRLEKCMPEASTDIFLLHEVLSIDRGWMPSCSR